MLEILYNHSIAKRILWGTLFLLLSWSWPFILQPFIATNGIQIRIVHSLALQPSNKQLWNVCHPLPQANSSLISLPQFGERESIDDLLIRRPDFVIYLLPDATVESVLWNSLPQERAKILAWQIGCDELFHGKVKSAVSIWQRYVPQAGNILAHFSVVSFDANEFDNALLLATLSESVDNTPSIEKVKLYNRFCLFSINQHQVSDALTWCRKLTAVSESNTSRFLMGRAYLLAQNYQSALNWLSLVQSGNNRDAALYYTAQSYEGLKQWQNVIETLNQIPQPGAREHLLQAKAWLHLGEQMKAVGILRQIVISTANPAIKQQACQLITEFQLSITCNGNQ